jgi:chromosomal replication initiator protein
MSDLWRRCLQRLEGELGEQVLHTWLHPMQAREDEGGLHLFAPNTYALERVRGEYLAQIEMALRNIAGRAVPVELEVGSLAATGARDSTPAPAPAPQTHHEPHNTNDK